MMTEIDILNFPYLFNVSLFVEWLFQSVQCIIHCVGAVQQRCYRLVGALSLVSDNIGFPTTISARRIAMDYTSHPAHCTHIAAAHALPESSLLPLRRIRARLFPATRATFLHCHLSSADSLCGRSLTPSERNPLSAAATTPLQRPRGLSAIGKRARKLEIGLPPVCAAEQGGRSALRWSWTRRTTWPAATVVERTRCFEPLGRPDPPSSSGARP
jgi:hypothetical protein